MVSVDEIEKSFNTDQTRAATPNISFDTSSHTSINDLYTPTEFIPMNESFEDPPTNAPSPSSLGSPPPRIITGRADRFISGNAETSSGSSLDLESPKEKVSLFLKKRKIIKPNGYESGDPDWQYNSHTRTYEFRPGMDFYSTKICQFEIEMEAGWYGSSQEESKWGNDKSS